MNQVEIPDGDLDDWLKELKPYQADSLRVMLEHSEPEEVAQKWITSRGPGSIEPFGGTRDTQPFWDRFRAEFRKFICDDQSYRDEKAALLEQGPISRALLVSAVSAAVGATIGYSAALLAPAITLLLSLVAKMGKNAYCSDSN